MCEHLNLIIIPTEENSWGIADTYHVKCSDCNKMLFENVPLEDAQKYVYDNMLKLYHD